MAEQEVIKHTKKAYKVWSNKEHSVFYKIREFVIEIFIIVFAITISIWFHNRSEHSHQQQEAKEFLLGLKADLRNDITEMKADSLTFVQTDAAFKYITGIKYGELANKDSLEKYQNYIFNTTGLIPNNGRFEGFKSSGKLGFIENSILQNLILDLYQEDIPSLTTSTNGFTERKKDLFHFIVMNRKRNADTSDNLNVLLSSDVGHNLSMNLRYSNEIFSRYSNCIQKSQRIINLIDQMYPEVRK
jgi:hypothetical protein